MTKRFFAIVSAILILVMSVPVYALGPDPSVPGYIIQRRKLDACNADSNDWLAGYIETAPSVVTDAVSRLSEVAPGAVPDVAVVFEPNGGFFQIRLLFAPAATSYSQANISFNTSNATWPYVRGYGDDRSSLNQYKYRTVTYSGSVDDFEFASISSSDGNTGNQYFMSGTAYLRYAAPWYADFGAATFSYPDDTCSQQVTVSSGYIAFDSPTTPPGPGYSGPGTILLQPGNLLIFEKSGGFAGVEDITITAENLPRSPLVGPWTTRNTIKSFPTLPDPSSVFVLPYSEWTAIPGTADWLGRSTSGSFVWRISQYSDDYAVYLNPIFGTDVAEGGLFGGNSADYNPFNKVLINDVSAYDRIMLVPVINRYGQSYIDYDSGSVIYDVSFNDDGTPEYSDDGLTVDSGVANKPGGATSIDDPYVDTVGGILGILERGAEAIRSLTSGAQSFFASIRDMFTWLPQEIQTILVSALALVFAVGVIKILH